MYINVCTYICIYIYVCIYERSTTLKMPCKTKLTEAGGFSLGPRHWSLQPQARDVRALLFIK